MRGLSWLLGAGALIGAGGFLMTQGDAGAEAHKKRDALAFPTYQRADEAKRATGRRTLTAPSTPAQAQGQAEAKPAHDPLLVALTPDASTALVFEAATILHAPVGQAMIGCLGADHRSAMDRRLKEQGKDWLEIADRVAFARSSGGHGMFVIEGNLEGIDWAKVAPEATQRPYGASTTVFDGKGEEGRRDWHAAVWHDSMLIASDEAASVEGAIDRLDAGGGAKLAFDESEAYGEVYGVVGRDELEKLVPEDLRDRVHEVTTRATIHVDATEEVLVVADVAGTEPTQVEDLGKSIGAAMAVGRLEAKREGADDLVRLLDLSRVRPYGNGRLRAELAIPTELMTKHMHGCKR
jgi:hypothetical protein